MTDREENIVADSPLRLFYKSIISVAAGEPKGYYTEVQVNSKDVGVLTPAQYREVTDSTSQGESLSAWQLSRVSERLTESYVKRYDLFVTAYVPIKYVKSGRLAKKLTNLRTGGVMTERLVLELSPESLMDEGELAEVMTELKREFGVKFLLSEYGGEYCPILRLKEFPFDYVMTPPELNTLEECESVSAKAAVLYAKDLSVTVINGARNNVNNRLKCSVEYDCYLGAGRTFRRRRGSVCRD